MIELEIQKAIFNRLSSELDVPVYSNGAVPDNVFGQYVVIGNDTHIEWDTDMETGWESTVTIHAWDNDNATRGFSNIKLLLGNIYQELHRAELELDEYNFIACSYEFSDTLIDADGLTRHGVVRFRIFTDGS
jgi:hypothetical protein